MPACQLDGIKYALGCAENTKSFNINEFNYSADEVNEILNILTDIISDKY